MMPTKEDIKKWLKNSGKSREWLAEQCGVKSKRSVDNWLADAGTIPQAKLLLIQKLMEETKTPPYAIEDNTNMSKLFVTLAPESQDAVLAECHRLNITLSAYCSLMMEWCATTQEGHAVIQSLITGAPLPSVNMNLAPLVQSSITNAAKEKDAVRKKFTPVEPLPAASFLDQSVPVIGNIAAGALTPGDNIPYQIKTDYQLGKGEYVLRVEGKSMEPVIPDGSLVVMRKHTIPPIPKVGTIVEYNDERGVTLKKLAQKTTPETGEKEYILLPLNPDYGEIYPMDGGKISGIYVETLERWKKA